MAAVRRILGRLRDRERDEGFTLMELLVAIGLLSILMAIVTTAIVSMFQAMRKQQGQADAIGQIRVVVDKLDKSVRYANAVNTPGVGTTAGTLYVEWRTGNLTGATNYTQTCTQWKFDSSAGTLQSRTWNEGDSTSISAWFTQATGISNNGTTDVFSFPKDRTDSTVLNPPINVTAAAQRQQLEVTFNAKAGVQQTTTRATDVILTAQNTTSGLMAAGKCSGLPTSSGTTTTTGYRP
jgi:prepilin-type N-terminal cleavage/methylation domain-containing protein